MCLRILDGCGRFPQLREPFRVRYERNVQFLGNVIKQGVPLKWCRVNEVKVESRRRLFGIKRLYERLRTRPQGEQRDDLSQGWQRLGEGHGLHNPGYPLERVPGTVHSAANLPDSDDYRTEGGLFGGNLEYPLRNPFRLAVTTTGRGLGGHWPFWDRPRGFCDCRRRLKNQNMSNGGLTRLTSDNSDSTEEDEARRGQKFGFEREIYQISNTRDVRLERRKARIEIHSPA